MDSSYLLQLEKVFAILFGQIGKNWFNGMGEPTVASMGLPHRVDHGLYFRDTLFLTGFTNFMKLFWIYFLYYVSKGNDIQ